MSIFDVVSAIAWGLTTVPIPEYNKFGDPTKMYGAIGDTASCKAQGFFIQLSFTSIFYNVTLSTYYLLGKKLAGRKCIDRLNRGSIVQVGTPASDLTFSFQNSYCDWLAGTKAEKKADGGCTVCPSQSGLRLLSEGCDSTNPLSMGVIS